VDLKTFFSCQKANDNPEWNILQGGLINHSTTEPIDGGGKWAS